MKVIPIKYKDTSYVLAEDCALDESWVFVCEHDLAYDKYEAAVICYNYDCTGITEEQELKAMLDHYDYKEMAESEW